MRARLYSWWRKISKPLDTVIISFIVVVIAVIIVSILGYLFHWEWTGLTPSISPPHPNNRDFLPGKTLWDWLQLLIIPAVLALGGYLFNYTTSRNERQATDQRAKAEQEVASKRDQTERDIASDNQREVALQAYIDKISGLLLEKKLRESQPEDEVRKIARVRTLTTLPRLDEARKGSIIQFLHESQLIDKENTIIDLRGANLIRANLRGVDLSRATLSQATLSTAFLYKANLSAADLSRANLIGAELRGADLSRADLSRADLSRANLSRANLSAANLIGADLIEADLIGANLSAANLSAANLSRANLRNAIVDQVQLDQTRSLTNAIMPDGSKHL